MAGIDFQAILDSMSAGNVSNDPIRSIYEILPIYDNDQQHLLFQAFYFIEKYDLADMRSIYCWCYSWYFSFSFWIAK